MTNSKQDIENIIVKSKERKQQALDLARRDNWSRFRTRNYNKTCEILEYWELELENINATSSDTPEE